MIGSLNNQNSNLCKVKCIHDITSAIAISNPEAIAIASPGRNPLTFKQLVNHIKNVVAELNSRSIGRNDRVAVVLPNGPDMAVTFLAVSTTAAFAPLNPSYGANEFDFYLSDLKAKVLIIQSGLDSPARARARLLGIPVIELLPLFEYESGMFTLRGYEGTLPIDGEFATPDDVALVLHTSGTTSRPKMVPLTHSNLCASALNIVDTLELTESDTCLNVMPLFHIHGLVAAVLSSLMAGGRVICTPGFYSPKFFEWMEEHIPTWYTAVPTMHQAILSRAPENLEIIKRCPLRFIRSSSSALPPKVMRELEDVFEVPVIESYGMTEASHQIASNPLPPRKRKPASVGVAAGLEVGIMDESGNLLPNGKTGEIVIRGANLTRGYENNQSANRDAFTGGWFRTGDEGYCDHDGYLFITGRIKEIMNRGGEKIAPREVEEVIMDHPSVKQVVVFAVPHSKLGEDVGAAIVIHGNASVTESEIRHFVSNRVADFKVPRYVVYVKEIPKGPTGKLQRIGLAERLGITASDEGVTESAFVPPSTSVEKKLAKIWCEVLGLKQVGINDNFLDIGGDSILATQIINKVREELQVELPLQIFIEAPTIGGFIQKIDESNKSTPARISDTIRQIPRDQEFPLSFAQQGMWVLDQLEPGKPVYNRPSAFRLKGQLNLIALEKSLNEIVRRHEIFRTTFPSVEGNPYQVISEYFPLDMEVEDLSDLPETSREFEAQSIAAEYAHRPFNLATGPLLRATLFKIRKEEHVLLLNMHHIVFDGWSMRVLLRELSSLYEAFHSGKPSPLKELPIQYGDFAHWQRKRFQGGLLGPHLAYWKHQLNGPLPVLELPAYRHLPLVRTYRGERVSLLVPNTICDSLREMSKRQGVTLFMTL